MKLLLVAAFVTLGVVVVIAMAFLFVTWYIHRQEKKRKDQKIVTYNGNEDKN